MDPDRFFVDAEDATQPRQGTRLGLRIDVVVRDRPRYPGAAGRSGERTTGGPVV